jgi:predicted ATP-grasp superfamily ATP-dependent carboligase
LLKESEEPHQKLWQEKIAIESEITSELLKKVYVYFEKKSTEPVVYIFEALIGLMRKAPRADHKSVEIYLKKYEGFVMAVDRVNVKTFNYTYCQQHLAALTEKYDAIIN